MIPRLTTAGFLLLVASANVNATSLRGSARQLQDNSSTAAPTTAFSTSSPTSAAPSQAPSSSPTVAQTTEAPTASPTSAVPSQAPTSSPTVAQSSTEAPTSASNTITTSAPSSSEAPSQAPSSSSTPAQGNSGNLEDQQSGIVPLSTSDFELGYGYDMGFGVVADAMNRSSFVNGLPPTKNTTAGIQGTKMDQITKHDDVSDVMQSTVSVQGTYNSVSASMAASYFQSSEVSSNSLSYYIGYNELSYKVEVADADNTLTLTDSAFQMLKEDPETFISNYGLHFVSGVNYGAAFAGTLDIYEKSSSNEESLDVKFNFNYNEIFQSLSVGAEYSDQYKQNTGFAHFHIDASVLGGDPSATNGLDPSNATTMGIAFDNWKKSINGNMVPVSMSYNSYYYLSQVNTWVMEQDSATQQKYYNLFVADKVETQTLTELSNERTQTNYVLKAAVQAMEFDCAKNDPTVESQFEDLKNAATQHLSEMETVSEADMINIQNGDRSIFTAQNLQNEYDQYIQEGKCVPLFTVICNADPTSPKCLQASKFEHDAYVMMPNTLSPSEAQGSELSLVHFEPLLHNVGGSCPTCTKNFPFLISTAGDSDEYTFNQYEHTKNELSRGGHIVVADYHDYNKQRAFMALPITPSGSNSGGQVYAICMCNGPFTGETIDDFCPTNDRAACLRWNLDGTPIIGDGTDPMSSTVVTDPTYQFTIYGKQLSAYGVTKN